MFLVGGKSASPSQRPLQGLGLGLSAHWQEEQSWGEARSVPLTGLCCPSDSALPSSHFIVNVTVVFICLISFPN